MPINKQMEEPTPSKFTRLSDSAGTGAMKRSNRYNGGSSGSPPIGLGLELGRSGGHSQLSSSTSKAYGFTISQLQELQLQSLIYKYVEAGFPVPCNLVLPIWNSVVSSLGGLTSTLQQLYPTFMGCSPMYMEYRNRMEAEPGRCRRTDGKKWRCSKEALPDQKYCERHMHRGRLRSRKLVEAANSHSQTSNSSATTTINLSISLPSTTTTTTNFSPRSGFSPISVLLGQNPKN